MHLIPQEDPRNRAYLTFLFIKRSTVLCHDFFALLAGFSAKHLPLRINVQHCLRSVRSQPRQIEVMYFLRHSLHGCFFGYKSLQFFQCIVVPPPFVIKILLLLVLAYFMVL